MAPRVQVILSDAEREQLHAQASSDGESLSAWLREAAHQRLNRIAERARFDSKAELDSFFSECDARESGAGPEPDWDGHVQVIDASRSDGLAET